MFQVYISQVEVHTFHQQVGGHQYFFVGVGEYGAVIANTVFRTLVLDLYVFRETVY